jgi:hypothetical protein
VGLSLLSGLRDSSLHAVAQDFAFKLRFLRSTAKGRYAEPVDMRSDAIGVEVWSALWSLGAPHKSRVADANV